MHDHDKKNIPTMQPNFIRWDHLFILIVRTLISTIISLKLGQAASGGEQARKIHGLTNQLA
jgi:hypothetical protein